MVLSRTIRAIVLLLSFSAPVLLSAKPSWAAHTPYKTYLNVKTSCEDAILLPNGEDLDKKVRDLSDKKVRTGPARGTRFTAENLLKHSDSWILLEKREADNQGAHGFCHIFGRLSSIEEFMSRVYKKDIRLSHMWIARKWIEYQIEMMSHDPKNIEQISEGGYGFVTTKMIELYGVVPESAYPYPTRTGITASASPLNADFKQLVQIKREALVQGLITRADFEKQLKGIIADSYGKTEPTQFYSELDGQMHTPASFRDKFLKFADAMTQEIDETRYNDEGLETAKKNPRGPLSKYAQNLYPRDVIIQDMDAILESIKINLQLGFNPTIDVKVWDKAVDIDRGLFSLIGVAKDVGQPGMEFTRKWLAENEERLDIGGHLMEVIGVQIGSDGKIAAVAVNNSWSGVSGYKGVFVITRDYLNVFLMGADVLSPHGFKIMQELAKSKDNPLAMNGFYTLVQDEPGFVDVKNQKIAAFAKWVDGRAEIPENEYLQFVNESILGEDVPKQLRPSLVEMLKLELEKLKVKLVKETSKGKTHRKGRATAPLRPK